MALLPLRSPGLEPFPAIATAHLADWLGNSAPGRTAAPLRQEKCLHVGRKVGDGPTDLDERWPKTIASPPRKGWDGLAQYFCDSLGLQQIVDTELGGVLSHGNPRQKIGAPCFRLGSLAPDDVRHGRGFFSWVSEDGKSGFDCFLDDMTHPAGRLH
jgi:hypothetical protein